MRRVFLYPYAGAGGRNYIKQIGTTQDVAFEDIKLEEGMHLGFYCEDADDDGKPDDLLFDGTVHFDREKQQWYVVVDEESYRHASDLHGPLRST
jgi:hypothetical protein